MKKALLLIGVILLAGCSSDDNYSPINEAECYTCIADSYKSGKTYYQDLQCGSIEEVTNWMRGKLEGRADYVICTNSTDGSIIEVSK